MWVFMCLFFPSLISLGIHKKLFGIKEKLDSVIIYAYYNILINFLICLICYIGKNHIYEVIDEYLFTFNFSVKYIGLALIFSFMLPYITQYLKNNVKIIIRRRNYEKKSESHK